MKQIALVSVAFQAIQPVMDCLKEAGSDIHMVNYLDSYLLEKVGKEEGVIRAAAMGRMFDMLVKARDDGAVCIIMTCTIFSPYAEDFSRLLGVSIICPDGAMLDEVAKAGGKTAVICTFCGTTETTKAEFFKYQRKNGMPESVDIHLVSEAFQAAQRFDLEMHDRLIREKIRELDPAYDHVVLAQISMARAGKTVSMRHARLWTSPESATAAAVKVLKKTDTYPVC